MNVYVITHKKFNAKLLKDKIYKILLVGSYKGHVFGDCYDDSGDNISDKNSSYCELTGAYWIWKNSKEDIVGITHYRRYFSNSFGMNQILSEHQIRKKLEKHDIILPFKRKLNVSLINHYCESSGKINDLNNLRIIIERLYPEYVSSYDSVMNGNEVYFGNMLICKKKIFDEYHNWLFSILFELEKITDISDYNDYQKRIYGFLSERLLYVWVKHNKLDVFECGVINTEERWSIQKKVMTGLKRWLLFRLQK